jgi:hypothetical protein
MGKSSNHNPECKNRFLNNLNITAILTWLEILTLFVEEGESGESLTITTLPLFSIVITTSFHDDEKIVTFSSLT